jgi:hypothetical protein
MYAHHKAQKAALAGKTPEPQFTAETGSVLRAGVELSVRVSI